MFVICADISLYSCCVCWFFFFKQKTAYEMRISDWSSDVCSSDLASLSVARGGGLFSGRRRLRRLLLRRERRMHDLAVADDAGVGDDLEIGRASCRERVCQYV